MMMGLVMPGGRQFLSVPFRWHSAQRKAPELQLMAADHTRNAAACFAPEWKEVVKKKKNQCSPSAGTPTRKMLRNR